MKLNYIDKHNVNKSVTINLTEYLNKYVKHLPDNELILWLYDIIEDGMGYNDDFLSDIMNDFPDIDEFDDDSYGNICCYIITECTNRIRTK